ncbi:hypothetical protein LEP1GSC166_2583 [Leptospira kirschneri]|nr:hypothetical protein LEP1GSC166_2583 [Leptospira kirschneri]
MFLCLTNWEACGSISKSVVLFYSFLFPVVYCTIQTTKSLKLL